MKMSYFVQLPVVMALAAALSASPAPAQGKGKGHKGEKDRTEQVRERRDRDRDDRDDRWEDDVRFERREERRGKQVPPGWCKGRGNPHNTVENCGPGAGRRSDGVYRRDGRYDDYDRRNESGRYEDVRYGGSYDEAHRAFHRDHDRICRERAAQRRFDLRWQLQVRTECKAEHDRWHSQVGRRH